MKRSLFTIIAVFFFMVSVMAQRSKDSSAAGTTIRIIKANKYNYQDRDSLGKFVSLVDSAQVQQEKVMFYADSMVVNQKENTLEAFGNIHINDADSVQVYSQYLKYLGKEKKAYLKDKVKLTDGKGILTTNELEYDTQFKIGKYFRGGKVINKKTILTSEEGVYYGDTRDMYFKKKVVLIDPEYKIYTDTLLYNNSTQITNIVAPSLIENGKRTIHAREGYYDVKHKKGNFFQRPFIDDSSYTFVADQMAFDDSSGLGEAQGNAVYRSKDSVNAYDIIANNIKTNKKTNAFLATQKPILFIKQEQDTIYVSADTLLAGKVSELRKKRYVPGIRDSIPVKDSLKNKLPTDSSNDRYFEAYYHVKIFSDSLQAVGDSLFYSLEDSTFRLFKDPVAWTQSNQITGDTIYLFLANKKPQRMYVFENAMAISQEAKEYFNQVRGNTMNAWFKGGKISFLKTRGSPADNVYYAQDDSKKFVGVNKSSSDFINVYFEEGKLQKVVFVNSLQGTMYPMKQVNHKEIRVRKFQWLDDRRPKSKFDILAN